MDPRRIELNRKHSREMGVLFNQFLDLHPTIESEVHDAQMTPDQDAAWTVFSAQLLARQQAERSALADVIEAEQERKVNAAQAISSVAAWIRSRGLDYPTEGLTADRHDAGWSVYAPVEDEGSDPMSFLDLPVGRSIFLVSDSGRIEEVSSSFPPQQVGEACTAQEGAARPDGVAADGAANETIATDL
ncbi:hypothetical protein ACWF82_22890 [Nocardia sp. NPDC055053]